MKKLVLSIMVALMLTVSAPTTISAKSNQETTCQNTLKYYVAVGVADLANLTVEGIVKLAQLTGVDDAAAAVAACALVVSTSTATIKGLGFGVECTYVDYVIDGHLVSIDPIRVITPVE